NVGRVRQHDLAEIRGDPGGIDGPPEAQPGELGQKPAVIDMGVGEDHPIYFPGHKGEVPVVALLQLLRPLEEAAVHQDLLVPKGQEVAGAAGTPGGTQKLDSHWQAPLFSGKLVDGAVGVALTGPQNGTGEMEVARAVGEELGLQAEAAAPGVAHPALAPDAI